MRRLHKIAIVIVVIYVTFVIFILGTTCNICYTTGDVKEVLFQEGCQKLVKFYNCDEAWIDSIILNDYQGPNRTFPIQYNFSDLCAFKIGEVEAFTKGIKVSNVTECLKACGCPANP